MAAGVALSAAAVVIAGIVVGTAAALRLLFSGDGRMTFDVLSTALLLGGFAVTVVATLVVPHRCPAPRPATLALAAIVSVAWPISGIPLPACLAAVLAVGLALARDIRCPGGRRVRGPLALSILAGLAAAVVIAGVAVAETYRIDRGPAEAVTRTLQPALSAPPLEDAPPAPVETATPSPDPETTAPAHPDTATSPDPTPAPDSEASPPIADPAPSPDPATSPDPTPAPDSEASPPVADPAPSPDPATSPEPTPSPDPAASPEAEAAPSLPADTAAPDPADFVRGYYEHLNAKRFKDAWASLSPAVQASFGGYDGWRNGYRTTLSSTPSAIKVEGKAVTHVLVARDRGCPERRFRVRWRLEPAAGTWTVAALSAAALDDVACR